MKPTVSIILPFHNAETTLPATMSSILNQTLQSFELILIDDGSSDSSSTIARIYQQNYENIHLVTRTSPGLPLALNLGLHHAASNIVARMDADDIMLPDRLEHQLTFMNSHPEIDVVSCYVTPFPDRNVTNGFQRYLQWSLRSITHDDIFADLYRESPLPHPSVMFKKSTVCAVNGYRDFDGPEDYDLWLRLARYGARFARIPRQLLKWRVHSHSLSRQSRRYRKEAFRDLSWEHTVHTLKHRSITLTKEIYICGAGQSGRRLCRYLMEHKIPVTGFIDVATARTGTTVMGFTVLNAHCLPELPDTAFLLFNPGNWGAQEQFETTMAQLHRTPLENYLVVSS